MSDVLEDIRDRIVAGRPRVTADYGGRRKIFDRRSDLLPAGRTDRRSGNDRRSGFDRRSALAEPNAVIINAERRTKLPDDNSDTL